MARLVAEAVAEVEARLGALGRGPQRAGGADEGGPGPGGGSDPALGLDGLPPRPRPRLGAVRRADSFAIGETRAGGGGGGGGGVGGAGALAARGGGARMLADCAAAGAGAFSRSCPALGPRAVLGGGGDDDDRGGEVVPIRFCMDLLPLPTA
jgi:hypothetical protein